MRGRKPARETERKRLKETDREKVWDTYIYNEKDTHTQTGEIERERQTKCEKWRDKETDRNDNY
jgi:hypothetical protein